MAHQQSNDTDQTKPLLDEKGKFAKGNTPPAGFNVHPENRSDGGWKKEMVFSYQYKRFMNMSVKELKAYKDTPDNERTVVEDLAYSAVLRAKSSLKDVREITDRTEGKAQQSIDLTSGGNEFRPITVEIIDVATKNTDT